MDVGSIFLLLALLILVVFFVTAMITPGDVVTAQLIMGAPMTALYFLSVGLSFTVARRRRRAEEAETVATGKDLEEVDRV